MYQSKIKFILFIVLSVFNLYGNAERSDKKGFLKVASDYPMNYQKDSFLNKTIINREIIEVPEITSTFPENEKEDVPTNTDIKISFKKATEESTNEDISIIIKDDNGNSIGLKGKKSENEYTFNTSSKLKNGARYSITVMKYIGLKNGATAKYFDSFSFSTEKDEIAPEFISSKIKSVYENQKNAITLVATDKNKIYYSISGNDSYKFNVSSSTGVVTFKQAPDFKTKNTYTFMAIAEDTAGNIATQDITININALDKNKPVFTSPNTISVKENNITAITLRAKDDNKITYAISGGDSDEFTVNSQTGVVRFNKIPNFETKKIYNFIAKAKDKEGNQATQKITIKILAVFDPNADKIAPIFISSSISNTNENQTNAIMLVATDDKNKVTYAISGDDSDQFMINKQTGVVIFEQAPDFEVKNIYNFTAKAMDRAGNQATQDVIINVLDVHETLGDTAKPVFISSSIVNIFENRISVMILVSIDKNKVTYAISGDDNDDFILNLQTGMITFKKAPDFETKNTYEFMVTATDTKGNKAIKNILVNILDVDETITDVISPVFISPSIITMNENPVKTIILIATDDNRVAYEISGKDSDKFTLNSHTGMIKFKKAPNYSLQKTFTFTAKAKDKAGNEAMQNITINILNKSGDKTIDDTIKPVFISPNIVNINENKTDALLLIATDENKITYSISGNDSDKFMINSHTGLIKFEKTPDFETKNNYTFIAKAKDKAGNEATQEITINVLDAQETSKDTIKPVFISPNTITINEHLASTIILVAIDETTVTYSISGDDSDKFTINSQTGILTFKNDPNYNIQQTYNFTAKAKDKAGNEAMQDTTINIVSTDIEFSNNHNNTNKNKIWQSDEQSTKKRFNWQNAKDYCANLKIGKYDNWELPSRYDLISLFSKQLNIIDMFSGDNWYWAQATYVINSGNAWAVDVEYGYDNWLGKTSSFKYVRCVRPE